jgi:hypothetical protein
MRIQRIISASAVLLLMSCGNKSTDSSSTFQESSNQIDSQTAEYALGSTGPGGGIVFYDAGSVQSWGRYLEAAPMDLPGEYNWQDAISAVEKYSGGGHSDWRLPTIEEWELLSKNAQLVGGFLVANYWSSTEIDAEYSWYWNFTSGTSAGDGWKPFSSGIYARPVRAFE